MLVYKVTNDYNYTQVDMYILTALIDINNEHSFLFILKFPPVQNEPKRQVSR